MSTDNLNLIVEKYRTQLTAILGTGEFDLIETVSKASYDEKLGLGKYELRLRSEPLTFISRPGHTGYTQPTLPVAKFELYPMIHCCGICVSTQAEVRSDMRHKGLGTLLNSMRIDIARYNGYGVLMCTDTEHNVYQRNVLKSNGWKDIYTFINPRTKNTVNISVIHL